MRSMKKSFGVLACCVALLSVGCGSESTLDIGEVGVLGAKLSDYAGKWSGYVEAHEFEDGSDRVRVLLDENGEGVLEVGDSDPLPPPDPEIGYPPPNSFGTGRDPFDRSEFLDRPAPGFSYPIKAAIVEERRVRFSARANELYRQWCEGMQPVLDEVNSGQHGQGDVYACLPAGAVQMFAPSQEECEVEGGVVHCSLLSCLWLCQCDDQSCTASDTGSEFRFDGALQAQGQELVGTLVLGTRMTVRLTRE